MKERLGGLALSGAGLLASQFTILDVWRAAQAGQASLSISMKGVVLSVTCILLGLGALALGPGFKQLTRRQDDPERVSTLGYILIFSMVGIAFGFYLWFKGQLATLGYQFD